MEKFYLKALDNLVTMEWQHGTADYSKVLKKGISGIIADIDDSISTHSGKEELEFLKGLRKIAETVILWAHKCSARVLDFAEGVERREYRDNLLRLSEALLRVPERPAESFWGVFEKHLYSDLDIAYEYDDKFNLARARDVSYVSCLLSSGCIENAKSLTQGGCDFAVSTPMMQGVTNLIDSLTVVKQFAFDERLFTMEELVTALKANWEGYGDMRALIIKRTEFFGNDTERSHAVASRLYESFYRYLKGKRTVFGYPILVGDILGYNTHNKWFDEKTAATPDGRLAGDNLKFGLGQSGGYDREGLTAYLNSVARVDPHGIGCGATVTKVTLDEALIKDDGNFEKTVDLFINYFRMGGVHFQPTYVSREELLRAKEAPDDYKHLRVRVTGFSEYFVKLNEAIQDDIIARTEQKYRKEKYKGEK